MDFVPHAVTGLVSALVPSTNVDVRLYSGILAGGIARAIMSNIQNFTEYVPMKLRSNCLYISEYTTTEEGRINPIYEQLQEYIVFKHFQGINFAQVIPKKGEITILPRAGLRFKDTFLGKSLELRVHSEQSKEKSNSTISISSFQLSTDELKQFVKHICKLEKTLHSTITVFRSINHNVKPENGRIEWDKIFVKTNKTLENTIYCDSVKKTLFDDIEWFMKNESWFMKRGMSYNKCYLLHGPPGTGKTSVTKIIANKYNLPVFILDLQSIKSDSELTRIVSEIIYLAENRYILSIEDIDRCSIFRDKYYEEREQNISIPCFLNFLDGIVETHGCIRIFSANDISVLENHSSANAIFRPGRIDTKVFIPHCNEDQLLKLFALFFEEDLTSISISKEIKICPAQFINMMTKSTKQEVIDFLQTGSNSANEVQQTNPTNSTNQTKRRTTQRKKTSLEKLQHEKKDLAKIEKIMENMFNRSEKIREKLYTKVSILERKKKRNAEQELSLTQKHRCVKKVGLVTNVVEPPQIILTPSQIGSKDDDDDDLVHEGEESLSRKDSNVRRSLRIKKNKI